VVVITGAVSTMKPEATAIGDPPQDGRWKITSMFVLHADIGADFRFESTSLMGVWGQSLQWGPGAEPLVRGSGAKPP